MTRELRLPIRVRREENEMFQCHRCGGATVAGIFVRADPATMPYASAAEDREDHEHENQKNESLSDGHGSGVPGGGDDDA